MLVKGIFIRATRFFIPSPPGPNPTITDTVTCDIGFGTREPCEMWKHYLETFAGYVNADFDAVSFAAAVVIGTNRGYVFKGTLEAQKELVSHRDDISGEFELDIWWEPSDGLIHFNYLSSLISISTHYFDYKDILEGYEPSNDVTSIINYQRFGYNWDFDKQLFRNFSFREDAASQVKYGGTYKGDFKGLRFIRDSAIANDVIARRILMRKDSITLDTFPFPLKAYELKLSDMIKITHFEGSGADGYDATIFQVRKTNYNLDDFTVKIKLQNFTNFMSGAFILGPQTLNKWTLESAASREKYGFVCDPATEEYSDGEPAKRLFD